MKGIATSIAKEADITNEDAALATGKMIAVSDGSGGGGVFAECWSAYMLKWLPDNPMMSYKALDGWIDEIWEPFYRTSEEKAKAIGSMLLNKFYDEGSFATLVAVWKVSDKECQWMSYGDSVAFCYNQRTGKLQHSFGRLTDFNQPPYLISCKDKLDEKGFSCGVFKTDKDCLVFAASDTLAHYILMMYEAANRKRFEEELLEAVDAHSKNSNFVRTALGQKTVRFQQDVLDKLISSMKNRANFRRHIDRLRRQGLIGYDDYSLAMM